MSTIHSDRSIADSPLSNGDLAPTQAEPAHLGHVQLRGAVDRDVVVITTYTLASGLMRQGMTWWQALLTISLGNLIVLVPMLLNAHPGTKYGIPFPVLVRASFGIRGANVPAMLRALVACGWFGIQTWIGALALDTLMTHAVARLGRRRRPQGDRVRRLLAVQVAIILRGIEGIKLPRELGGAAAARRRASRC